MNQLESQYLEKIQNLVLDKISQIITLENKEIILKKDLIESHLHEKKSAQFQKYYFLTLNNSEFYFQTNKFFHQFKRQYGLQGIDNDYLDFLESNKKEILDMIQSEELSELYFKYFFKARIKFKEGFKEKNLGSFFSKIIHTFTPEKYCALDNPIKNYLGLEKESFFIAFQIISKAYTEWAEKNQEIIQNLKSNFKDSDTNQILDHPKITDLKLIDLVLWSKANRK